MIQDLPVSAGSTYWIKVADYNTLQGGGDLQVHVEITGPVPDTIFMDGFEGGGTFEWSSVVP
jgi:hypothetical protein